MSGKQTGAGAVTWTTEQWQGITLSGCNLLLSAAAGSGKTAVLAERCAHLVCDAEDRCNVDELLVVTFNEAAAAEVKSRIAQNLRNRLELAGRHVTPADDSAHANPSHASEHAILQKQLALIERAPISTLHAFCARLLGQHYHRVGLDPQFGVIDGEEAVLLRNEVARDLFFDRYENDSDGRFANFVDCYGDGNDEGLRDNVIRTHALLTSVVDPEAWIAHARQRLIEAAELPPSQSEVGRELLDYIAIRIKQQIQRCNDALATLDQLGGFPKYSGFIETLHAALLQWSKAFAGRDIDSLAQAMAGFQSPRKPAIRGGAPGHAQASALVEAVRNGIFPKSSRSQTRRGALASLVRFSARQWQDGMRRSRQAGELFLDLVQEFGQRYQQAKQRERSIDFADMEALALRVLRAPGDAVLPSAIARGYQRQFKHVLVDEYQDINQVQDTILTLLSRQRENADKNESVADNLFCVGDVKQSIYRFRLAEPQRFTDRRRRYQSNAAAGKVIDLRENFRSRAPLLEVLNSVFSRLMTEESAGVEYDQSHHFRAHVQYPPADGLACFNGAPLELHLLSDDKTRSTTAPPPEADAEDAPAANNDPNGDEQAELDRSQREATLIAARIHEMMRLPMQVAEKIDGKLVNRPIRYRDIVILLRTMHKKSDQFADVLGRHNIPVHRESREGYFASTEVRDMLNLLRILDNPRQDIPLAAVLRSPFASLPEPENCLACIRLKYPPAGDDEPMPFHVAVTRYAQEQPDELAAKLHDFLADLAQWRQMARQRPLAELIWNIYQTTGHLAFCSGLSDGAQRCANLMELHERARQFGTFSRQGLYRFLEFLDSVAKESNTGEPSVLGEAEDVVRIMSIHKAKGLEYPVVFLPDLGKRFNLTDCSGHILVDRKEYVGLAAADQELRIRYPTMASFLVREELLRQALAEELRVLYVAMTRAREYLILLGTTKQKNIDRWSTDNPQVSGPLPTDVFLSAGCMLDWIGPVALSLGGGAFTVYTHHTFEITATTSAASADKGDAGRLAALANLEPLDTPPQSQVAQEIITGLRDSYGFEPYAHIPASQSVSEWTKGKGDFGFSILDFGLRNTGHEPAPADAAGRADGATAALDHTLPPPRFLMETPGLSGADIGTATHLVLENLDFARRCDAADIDAQIAGMVGDHKITPQQAAHVDRQAVAWLMDSDLGVLIHQNAKALMREVPFNFAVTSDQWPKHDTSAAARAAADAANIPDPRTSLDHIMIRGRIDLLLPTSQGFAVIDYKTDRVFGPALETRAQYYDGQVQFYRRAVAAITGKHVDSVYLVFLASRRVWQR